MVTVSQMKDGRTIKQRILCKEWKLSISQGRKLSESFPQRVTISWAVPTYISKTITLTLFSGDTDQYYFYVYMSVTVYLQWKYIMHFCCMIQNETYSNRLQSFCSRETLLTSSLMFTCLVQTLSASCFWMGRPDRAVDIYLSGNSVISHFLCIFLLPTLGGLCFNLGNLSYSVISISERSEMWLAAFLIRCHIKKIDTK